MDNTSSLIGKTVKQVRCDGPEYNHLVGRVSKVRDAFSDEKGNVHVNTEDGYWAPLRLMEVVG